MVLGDDGGGEHDKQMMALRAAIYQWLPARSPGTDTTMKSL
jgi:hypothetical protein